MLKFQEFVMKFHLFVTLHCLLKSGKRQEATVNALAEIQLIQPTSVKMRLSLVWLSNTIKNYARSPLSKLLVKTAREKGAGRGSSNICTKAPNTHNF